MPAIPQYVSQQRAQGFVASPGGAPTVDVSGLNRFASQLDRDRQELERAQQAEQKRLEHNEAVSYATNLDSESDIKWTERLQTESTGDANGMTERVLKDFDAYKTEALAKAPDAARPLIENTLARKRSQLHAQSFKYETQARQANILQADDEGADNDARALYADPSQFTDKLARRLAATQTLDIPEAVKADRKKRLRETLAFAAASSIADRDPEAFLAMAGMAGGKAGKDGKPLPSSPEEAAKAVRDNPILSNMDPKQLHEVVSRATLMKVQRDNAIAAERERQIRLGEMAAAKRDREATQAYTILTDWAREGVAADPAAAKPLLDKLAGTPYQAAYQQVAATVQSRSAAAMLPLAVQDARLDALYTKRAQGGTSEALEREIKQSEEVRSAARRDYKEEPLRALEKRGLGVVVPLDMKSGIPGLLPQLDPMMQLADKASQITGKPESPLLRAQAEQVARMLSALPPDQKAVHLAELATKVGPKQAQAIALQINEQDRPLALALALGAGQTTYGRPASTLVLKGAQAIKDKTIKDDNSVATGVRARVAEIIGDSLSGEAREAAIDAAKLIYYGMQADGHARYDNAVRMAVGGQILDYNGGRVVAPIGMDEPALKAAITATAPAAVAKQAPEGTVYVGGQPLGSAQFLAAIPGAQLLPAGDGVYYVQTSQGVVKNAKREPIKIGVR